MLVPGGLFAEHCVLGALRRQAIHEQCVSCGVTACAKRLADDTVSDELRAQVDQQLAGFLGEVSGQAMVVVRGHGTKPTGGYPIARE